MPIPNTGASTFQTVETLFTPADFGTLPSQDLSGATCVVFDVLRATTSMVTALTHGARAVIPVAEIEEALAIRAARPDVFLAGERNGLRIGAALTGGVEFDFGNSPREFTTERVRGRTIVTTTTNGTRALRACAGAQTTLVGSFLNLSATAKWLLEHPSESLVVICSGTFEQTAYEDAMAAGALLELLSKRGGLGQISDAVVMAMQLWERAKGNVFEAASHARNARKLLSIPELAEDVPFSLRRDSTDLVTRMTRGGEVISAAAF